MNVPYFFAIVNYVLSKTLFEKYGYFYLAFVAVSCFTSLLNPLLIVMFNYDLKQFIIQTLARKRTAVIAIIAKKEDKETAYKTEIPGAGTNNFLTEVAHEKTMASSEL
jgi:hypothetical protein